MKMRFTDYTTLAFRNLRRQRFRSLLAIFAIVIGAASITLMLSLVTGARNYYMQQFTDGDKLEQVIVSPQTGLSFEESQRGSSCTECVKLTDTLASTIQAYDNVTGLSPTANVNIFESLTLDDQKEVVGSAQSYDPNGVIQHNFIAGQDFSSKDAAGKVIIGQTYADKWGYKGHYQDLVGKEVTLTTTSSYTGEGASLPDPLAQFKQCQNGSCKTEDVIDQYKPTSLKATIVGVQTDDSNGIFVPLNWAKTLLASRHYEITPESQAAYSKAFIAWNAQGRVAAEPVPEFTLFTDSLLDKNGYTSFVVRAASEGDTDVVAAQIRTLGVGAVTAKAHIQSQLEVFSIVSLILGSMGGIALFVAAIGVINIMVMAILERTREIGVMRAVGARRSTIRRLFTLEASLLGLIGGVCGVIVGYGLIMVVNIFINVQLDANGVVSRNIIGLSPWLAVSVVIAATVIGMLAGLYPAQRAARLDPGEALREV